jgi:hypothetical protein
VKCLSQRGKTYNKEKRESLGVIHVIHAVLRCEVPVTKRKGSLGVTEVGYIH